MDGGGDVGFVVGLKAEARLLRGYRVGVGGGGPAGAARAAASLLDEGVRALISFGFAGGLSPARAAGQVIIPANVMMVDARYACDAELCAWLGGANADSLFAGSGIAVTVAEKAALFAQTGAVAIDLESGVVARAAAARGVPMAVLRAISDPATRGLPSAALLAVNAGGGIGLGRVVGELARHPGQLSALLALAADAGRARAALRRRVRTLRLSAPSAAKIG